MMEHFERFLVKLDTLLEARNERERILIFLMPVILFGAIAYQYLIPTAQQANRSITGRLTTITAEINTYRNHLSAKTGGSKSYLEKLESENRELRQKVADAKDLTLYAEGKLQALGFVHFTPASWSDFLHRLTTYAAKSSIAMGSFTNRRDLDSSEGNGFEKVLSVDFNTTGDYYHMVNFIRDIENDRAITHIEKLSIESGSKLKADFSISLWGLVR
jgi:hypothetical protein